MPEPFLGLPKGILDLLLVCDIHRKGYNAYDVSIHIGEDLVYPNPPCFIIGIVNLFDNTNLSFRADNLFILSYTVGCLFLEEKS